MTATSTGLGIEAPTTPIVSPPPGDDPPLDPGFGIGLTSVGTPEHNVGPLTELLR